MVYYINALGLFLNKDSYWGVWILELLLLTLSILLCFSLIKDRFNTAYALIGTAVWVLALGKTFTVQFGAGNHVEEYALLLYFVQMYLYFHRGINLAMPLRLLGIGFFASLSVLLRPNLISPILAIYALILWDLYISSGEERKRQVRSLFTLTAGWMLPSFIVVLYFWQNQALYDLYHDVLVYNLLYTTGGTEYWSAFLTSFRALGFIHFAAIAAWLLLVWFYPASAVLNKLQGKGLHGDDAPQLSAAEPTGVRAANTIRDLPLWVENRRMAWFLILAFPAEVILSLLSGYGYIHYFISWLLIEALLFCFFIAVIQALFERAKNSSFRQYAWIPLVLALTIQAIPFLKDIQPHYSIIAAKWNSGIASLLDYRQSPEWAEMVSLYDSVPEGTQVMFWGNEVQYNFSMNLPAPTRYMYLYPFMTPGYARDDMLEEFFTKIRDTKPLIVDIQPSSIPPIKSIAKWKPYPSLMPMIYYINRNYYILREIQVTNHYLVEGEVWNLQNKWIVWVHK